MDVFRLREILFLVLVASTGCSALPWSSVHPIEQTTQIKTPKPEPLPAVSPSPETQAMHAMIDEIDRLHALDEESRKQLLENLQQTPPTLWPLMMKQFRAALAFRLQGEESDDPANRIRSSRKGLSPGVDTLDKSALPNSVANTKQPQLEPKSATDPSVGTTEQIVDQKIRPKATLIPTHVADTPSRPVSLPVGPSTKVPPSINSQTSNSQTSPSSWQTTLEKTTQMLASTVSPTPQTPAEISDHVRLRMLYLAAGRRQESLRPIPSIAPAMQDFWNKEFYGLATLLEPELISDPAQRTAEAKRHLSKSILQLSEIAPLIVRNLAFVTRVQSYGSYEPFKKNEFVSGQNLLLYAEIDNFTAKQTHEGYHTPIKIGYQIFDSRGQRVAEDEFVPNDLPCRNPRRDFFIGYEFPLPKKIYAGRYVMQLTVVDLNSMKIGQSSIEFDVASPNESKPIR